MDNLAACDVTLDELRRMGRLEPVDAALVEAVRSMARALDEAPGNAQLWKQYRDGLEALTGGDSDDDTLADLLDELSAEVGDPEEG